MTGPESRVYVRRTSGLVRIIGPFAAMVFGVHCISLSSSGLIPYAWVPWLWPGADLLLVLTIGMLFCLFHAITYAQIGSIYPRSGSDYILATRALGRIGPWIEIPLAFGFLIFTFMTSGALIAWIPSAVLPSFLWTWGTLFNEPSLIGLSEWVGSPGGVITIGLLFVLATFVLTILSTRRIIQILEIGFFLGIAAWAVMLLIWFVIDQSTFKAAWNNFSPVKFDEVISLAKQNGLQWGVYPPLTGAFAGIIMAFWIYYGYYIPSFFAGELKEAPRTLIIGNLSALIVTWAIFSLGAVALYPRLMSLEWMASEGYLYYMTDVWALPFSTYYASIAWAYLFPGIAPLMIFLVALAFVYTLINLAQTYFFYGSRLLFAMAFDRILPSPLIYVTKGGAPLGSMIVAAIFSAIGVILSQTTVIFVQFNFVLYACIYMLPAVIAAILFPIIRKEEFGRAAKLVNIKMANIPLISLVGVVTLGYLIWMIMSQWLYTEVSGVIGTVSMIWFALVAGTGFVIFYAKRQYTLKKEGIDILWAFKEIPPA